MCFSLVTSPYVRESILREHISVMVITFVVRKTVVMNAPQRRILGTVLYLKKIVW